MNKTLKGVLITLMILFFMVVVFFSCTQTGIRLINTYQSGLQKADENTQYETRKMVEDQARMMMASYEADRLRYEQYKTSTSQEQLSWGEQAKMRANQTASTYNQFMMKNSFLFKENIPRDIRLELPILN